MTCMQFLLLEVCIAIDYRVTVETPITLVANNNVLRQQTNGTCCSPTDPTDCTICPDDPSVEFNTFICFRTGYIKGFFNNIDYCPLGGIDREPNSAPGARLHLTPRIEAQDLPRTYPVRH